MRWNLTEACVRAEPSQPQFVDAQIAMAQASHGSLQDASTARQPFQESFDGLLGEGLEGAGTL